TPAIPQPRACRALLRPGGPRAAHEFLCAFCVFGRKHSRSVIARTLTTLGLVFSACQSIAQSPSLNYSEPSAVAPGKTTTVTFFGDNLKDPTELWTSFPAKATLTTTTNSNEAGKATFQIAVPK